MKAWRRALVFQGVTLSAALGALVLSSCTTSTAPPATGVGSSPSVTVVRSNVGRGDLNLFLSDVSCSSIRDCWAIGEDVVPEGQSIPPNGALLVHYDGHAWHQVLHTGDAQSSNPPQLGALSCPAVGWCMATVGFAGQAAGVRYPSFAIVVNGRLFPHSTTAIESFSAIDCRSKADCVGVGTSPSGGFAAAKWNGATWTAMSTSNVNGRPSAVSCPTATYCLAVGTSFGSTSEGPGAMQWNGSAWHSTARPIGSFGTAPQCRGECPEPPTRVPTLTAVSCTSATQCVALGSGYSSFGFSWNGVAWTEVSALLDMGISELSCPPGGPCLAVGGTKAVSIEGTTVSAVNPPPSLARGRAEMNAVDCPSTQQCVVLGTASTGSMQSQQVAVSWEGDDTWQTQRFAALPFAMVSADTTSEQLGPCAGDPKSKVVTVFLVPHRGFAAVSPTCQIVESGQRLYVHNATRGAATTSIGTTFIFTLKPGETAQLQPALSRLLEPGHHSLEFTGSNYGTFVDLWVGGRSHQPGYVLMASSTLPLSSCSSVKSGRVVAAYMARNELLYRSFPWAAMLNAQRPGEKMTLCVLLLPSHARSLRVLGGSGTTLLSTPAPRSVVVEHF